MGEPNFRGTMLLLQNRTKRDPEAYEEEFKAQLAHFDAHSKAMATSSKQHSNAQYLAVLSYICHVSHLYQKQCAHVPQVIIDTLKNKGKGNLDPETRITLVKNLILLRGRGIVTPDQTMPVFFDLLMIRDKALRKLILSHTVGDIKRINLPNAKNSAQLNKKVQSFLFGVMKEDDPVQAYSAMVIVIDLYRRQIWADERAVEVLTEACFSKHSKILRVALRFFLMQMPKLSSMESDNDEDEAIQDPGRVISKMKQKLKIKAKTKKRERILEREKKTTIKKYDKEAKEEEEFNKQHVDPIRLLRDPQTFCEKLFGKLQKTSERFETRILYLNVISRVINEHEVVILSLYPFLERYMEPSQLHSTQLLALSASCVHKMIPPDYVEPLLRTIANHFVNDRSDPDSITIGINTIREICKRQPLAMTKPLLADLAEYKSHRGHRGVIMAARAMIQLYRAVAPDLLPNKLRGGKNAPSGAHSDEIRFGAAAPLAHIPGMEMLLQHTGEIPDPDEVAEGTFSDSDSDVNEDDVVISDADEDGSDASSESGSWINVSHSDEDEDDGMSIDEDLAEYTGSDDDEEEEDDEEAPELIPANGATPAGKAGRTSTSSKTIVSPFTGKRHSVVLPSDDPDVWLDEDEDNEEEEHNAAKRKRAAVKTGGAKQLPEKRKKTEEPEESEDEEEDDEESDEEVEMDSDMEEGEWVSTDDEEESDDEEEEDEEDDAKEEVAANVEGAKGGPESDSDFEPVDSDEESMSGSWVEVSHSDDDDDLEDAAAFESASEEGSDASGEFYEDVGDDDSVAQPPSIAPSATTSAVSGIRILSDADFAKIRELDRIRAQGGDHRSLRGKKKYEFERQQKKNQIVHGISADLQPSMIETFTNKKRTMDKDEKIARAVEARKEKLPYNARKKSKAKLFSTNIEKAKRGKLYQMTKRSQRVAEKIKRSTVERGDRKKDMKKKDVKFRIRRGWKA